MIRRSVSPSPRGPQQQSATADILSQKSYPQPPICGEFGAPYDDVICRMEAHIAAMLISVVASPNAPPKASLRQVFLHTLILSEVHSLALQRGTCTQRDLYYHLCRKVSSQAEVNAAVQQLCTVLNVPRKLLGIQAGFRGSLGGAMTLNGVDLRNIGQQGLLIPGALAELQEVGHSQGDALCSTTFAPHIECHPCLRFLLIIEKDAVFQKLMAERIFDVLPCVLLSGHGFPSLAARAMAHYILSVAPHLLVLGLADYNPSGVHILLQFKEGRGSPQYALPALKWLGVHSEDLSAESSLKPFSHRCKAQLRNLLAVPHASSKLSATPVEWLPEIHRMKDGSVSAEIESLYSNDGAFSQFVASKALRQQYF